MLSIQLTCPHCHAVKACFAGSGKLSPFREKENLFLELMQCAICHEGIVAKIKHGAVDNAQRLSRDQQPSEYSLVDHWPKRLEAEIPTHIPDNVKSYYLQGVDCSSRKSFDAAGAVFRKTLEAALRALPSSGSGTLAKRIGSLPEEVGVTISMKKWAEEIRLLGNDAVHEEAPFTEKEAAQLQLFTKLFLVYAFTLPGMLSDHKQTEAVT